MDKDCKRIASDVKIGKDVKIADFVNLYGCEIGDGTKIGSFVEVQKNARIGRRCKIRHWYGRNSRWRRAGMLTRHMRNLWVL